MKLSRKADYALRALVTLAQQEGAAPISVRTLARTNDIPRRFLDQIMVQLREKGVVRSIPGRVGGFVLAIAPEHLSMGKIVRIFDEMLSPIACVSSTHYEGCSQEAHCRFRRVLLDIRNYTVRRMEEATLASLAAGPTVEHREVFDPTYEFGDGI